MSKPDAGAQGSGAGVCAGSGAVLSGFSVDAGVLAGSAFSIRFGEASVPSVFFALDFGAGDSSGSGVGLFFTRDFFPAREFPSIRPFSSVSAVGSHPSPSCWISLFPFSLWASTPCGSGRFFSTPASPSIASSALESPRSSSSPDFFVPAFVLLFGVGGFLRFRGWTLLRAGRRGRFRFGSFFDLALRFAGFGFAVGSGVSSGAGESTARISSRALLRASRFFLSSSVNCALTKVATIALEGEDRAKKNAKSDHGRRA